MTTLTLLAVLDVTDETVYVKNSGTTYPLAVALSHGEHDDFTEFIGDLGGADLAVVPAWPMGNFGFSVERIALTEDRTTLLVWIGTDLSLDYYLTEFIEDIDLDDLTGSCDCGAKYVPADASDHCGECGSCFEHCSCEGGPNPHIRALIEETS